MNQIVYTCRDWNNNHRLDCEERKKKNMSDYNISYNTISDITRINLSWKQIGNSRSYHLNFQTIVWINLSGSAFMIIFEGKSSLRYIHTYNGGKCLKPQFSASFVLNRDADLHSECTHILRPQADTLPSHKKRWNCHNRIAVSKAQALIYSLSNTYISASGPTSGEICALEM